MWGQQTAEWLTTRLHLFPRLELPSQNVKIETVLCEGNILHDKQKNNFWLFFFFCTFFFFIYFSIFFYFFFIYLVHLLVFTDYKVYRVNIFLYQKKSLICSCATWAAAPSGVTPFKSLISRRCCSPFPAKLLDGSLCLLEIYQSMCIFFGLCCSLL